jgi:ABC-type uncharacterized transport system permease subunit
MTGEAPASRLPRTPPRRRCSTLERALFRLIAIGFALFSGIPFTSCSAARSSSRTRTLAVASWLVFGALVVGRWRYGWRGRAALR